MPEVDKQRKRIMQAVKCKDTKPEKTIRSILSNLGYRYRLQGKDLPGCPDLIFRRKKKAIFVNGCFWHGHQCPRGKRIPKNNKDYWVKKISGNVQRDAKNGQELAALGWKVLIVWECEIRNQDALKKQMIDFLEDSKS